MARGLSGYVLPFAKLLLAKIKNVVVQVLIVLGLGIIKEQMTLIFRLVSGQHHMNAALIERIFIVVSYPAPHLELV
jgi:hypothetical protein